MTPEEQFYLVGYTEGSHDDFCVRSVFITTDFDKAESWVKKFNKTAKNGKINFNKVKYKYVYSTFTSQVADWNQGFINKIKRR